MSSLLIFILTVIVVLIVIDIGAVSFEITGMPPEKAKFQAISCFTLTGYTTRESESVMMNTDRRRIASYMMISGYVSAICLFAAIVNFFQNVFSPGDIFMIPGLNISIPAVFVGIFKSIFTLCILLFVYKLFFKSFLWKKISEKIKERIKGSNLLSDTTFDEMILGETDYGLIKIIVKAEDSFCDKTIVSSRFKHTFGAQILTIERNFKSIPNPHPEEVIHAGDVLYCFGNYKEIRHKFEEHRKAG